MGTDPRPPEGPAAFAAFAAFLEQFAESLRDRPHEWENTTLGDFLRAWSAWVKDMDGYFASREEPVPDQPTWGLLMDMLRAARVYE